MNSQPKTLELSTQYAALFNRVYAWTAVGVFITALVAYVGQLYQTNILDYFRSQPNGAALYKNIMLGIIIAQFIEAILFMILIRKIPLIACQFLFLLYAFSVGVTFSTLFLVYQAVSVYIAFSVTAFAFLCLSLYGFYTQRDLTALGRFCMMGLFGLIGYMLIGMFIPTLFTDATQFVSSCIGIIVFAGLTAYDNQRIKSLSAQMGIENNKAAIYGAFILYLDFINLFLFILKLFGRRR